MAPSTSKFQVKSTSPTDIVLGSENFVQVLQSSAFRDKTGLIKFFIKSKNTHMVIHGPSRFGKSVNLNMIKNFLQAEISPDGKPLNPRSTDKYKVYYENNLEVSKETDLLENYFGQYPTIYFNFNLLNVKSYKDFLASFRGLVSMAYRKHSYLINIYKNSSNGIHDQNLSEFLMYRNSNTYTELTELQLLTSGSILSEMLAEIYGKECYLFVDEFDLPLTAALLNPSLPLKELELIIDFLIKFLGTMIKSGESKVARSFLTGITRVGSTCTKDINNLEHFRILDSPEISKYYGFTHADVEALAKIFNQEDLLEELKIRYDGYKISGGKDEDSLYPPVPILRYFQKRDYEPIPVPGRELAALFKYEKMGPFFEKTIKSGTTISLMPKLERDDFLSLRNFLSGSQNYNLYDPSDLNLALNYFFDSGLYTYKTGDNKPLTGRVDVVVTNLEIQESFERALYTTAYVCKKYHIQEHEKLAYVEAIADIGPEDEKILALKSSIEAVLKKARPAQESEMHTILFGLVQESSQFCIRYKRHEPRIEGVPRPVKKEPNKTTIGVAEPDFVFLTLKDIALIIELKWHKSADEAHNQIKLKGHFEAFNKPPLKGSKMIHKGYLGINWSKEGTVTITYSWDSLENPKRI